MILVTTPNQPPIQRVTTAPPSLVANNPTAPRILCTKQRTHQQQMRNNTPGALPAINRAHRFPMLPIFTEIPEQTPVPPKQILAPTPISTNNVATTCCSHHLINPTLPSFHNVRFISQEAINSLITNNLSNSSPAFTLLKLCPNEHNSLAMVHPVRGKHITSYEKLIQDLATSDV